VLNYLLSRPPDITGFILFSVAFILSLSLHEFGHAFVATLQGDPTPKAAGRLTVNPKAHLDPVGTFMIVLVGFGWGKPVPFAPNKLSSQRFGPAMVGIAGPMVNMILAYASAIILSVTGGSLFSLSANPGVLQRFLLISLYLNVVLAVFNLLPIPPLDGSRILSAVLPPSRHHIIYFLDKWGFLILLGVVFLLRGVIIDPIVEFVARIVVVTTGLS
jgi:Zn-dependent protease